MRDHADYFAIRAVNWSTLKAMDTSALHYRHRERTELPDTAAMRLGRAVHCVVLEPDVFPLDYTTWSGDRRTKAYAEFAKVNAGKTILTEDEYETCLGIAKAVRRDKDARRLLARTKREQTVLWTDPATGLRCKCRPDAWKKGLLLDLKTTKSLDRRAWERTAADFDYYGQEAFYARGLTARTGISEWEQWFIAVESAPPFDVGTFYVDGDSRWYAAEHVRRLLDKLAEHRRSRRWPGRYQGPQELRMPAYLMDRYDQEAELAITRGAK